MQLPKPKLPQVVSTLNGQATCLIGKKPAEAIKEKVVAAQPFAPYHRPVWVSEENLSSNAIMRYLYQPGQLEGAVKEPQTPPDI